MLIDKHRAKLATLALLGLLLLWRILVVGFSDRYASEDTPEAAAAALGWRSDQPRALYRRGTFLAAEGKPGAEPLLLAAIWADPTNALAYIALAKQWAASGQVPQAIRLAETAEALGPMRTPAIARSADFWFALGQPDRGIERWSALVKSNPATANEVFPQLLRFAGNPISRPLLLSLMRNPPEWWDRFFLYATANAPDADTVVFLYRGRNRAGALPSPDEQRVYLDRLWKDGRWTDAYMAWLEGLDAKAKTGLGHLYNGGFELPIGGIGFDWRIAPVRGARTETTETYGTRGTRSLLVALDGLRGRYRHLEQRLFLSPGAYRLTGRVRPAGLMPTQGVRWALYCSKAAGRPIATTDTFSGKEDWQAFAADFDISETECPVQILRLEQEPLAESSGDSNGSVWFDDLAIELRSAR